MKEEDIIIRLGRNEAIVLFGYLSRSNKQAGTKAFEDQSEQRVLWNLEAILAEQLTEPFRSDYPEILKSAREAIRDKE